jgi:hypothetical protein
MLYIKNQIRIQPQTIYQKDKAITVSASLIALLLILIGSIMSNPLIVYAQEDGGDDDDGGGGGDDDDGGGGDDDDGGGGGGGGDDSGDSGGGDNKITKSQSKDNNAIKTLQADNNVLRTLPNNKVFEAPPADNNVLRTLPNNKVFEAPPADNNVLRTLPGLQQLQPGSNSIESYPYVKLFPDIQSSCDPSIETCSIALPQPSPAVGISEIKDDVIKSEDYLDNQPPEKRTKFLNNIVDNMIIPDTRQDLVESKMFLDRLSPAARAEVLYLVINSMSKSFKMLPEVQAQAYQPSTLPRALPISSESSAGTTPQQLEQHGDAIILSPEIRQEILTKYNPSERAKIIPAAQNLGFAITAIIPGSAVIVDLTERTQLQTLLNQVEVQKFLELHDKPTAENLAAFLNIPIQKLGEFLNMLTPDELTEIFYKVLPEDASNKILSSITADEQIKIKEKLQSSANSNL